MIRTDPAGSKNSVSGGRADLPGRGTRAWGAVALAWALCALPVLAQTQTPPAPVTTATGQVQPPPPTGLRLKTPEAAVRLYGADCHRLCSLSALFAPAVERDRVAAVPVTNLSTQPVIVSVHFVPTNALAMAKAPQLALEPVPTVAGAKNLLADPKATILVPNGDTAQLKLALQSTRLPAGLYTGQIEFHASPAAGNAVAITQIATVEMRIRDSAIWALLAVVAGLLLGRLAQLVYDPQVMAKIQLLDWIHQLEADIAQVPDAGARQDFTKRLKKLKDQLFSRSADVAALKTALDALQKEVDAARGVPAAAAKSPGVGVEARGGGMAANILACIRGAFRRIGAAIAQGFRILAGVTPLPLQSVYDWLLPFFVLLTLIALTVVFMLQQYGSTGAAETFGAGGLADYAGLFLAGIASEAIAGGLRAVKLRP
jgi:hypothetical protein